MRRDDVVCKQFKLGVEKRTGGDCEINMQIVQKDTLSFRLLRAIEDSKGLSTLRISSHCSEAQTRATPVPNAAAPMSVKGKVQRNPQSPYGITLPVLGSMRLPATKPVVGSVPIGRRKSRMCGSGLAAAGAGAGSERAVGWLMRQGSGGCGARL